MLGNAPTDRGKRYVASAVICNNREEELFKSPSDFLNFLLWLCTSKRVSYFFAHHLLVVKSAYKSKTPTVSEYSTITIPETEALCQIGEIPTFSTLYVFCLNDNLIFMSRTAQRATGGSMCRDTSYTWLSTAGAHIIRRSLANRSVISSSHTVCRESCSISRCRQLGTSSEDTIDSIWTHTMADDE